MKKADDLRLWRVFVLLADRGNLTEVADELDVEISSVSRALTQLEKSIGHPLFKRNSRPATLTDLGQSVLGRVRRILELQDALLDELRTDAASLTGEVRLSVSPGFAATDLPFYLAQFNALHPTVSFRVATGLGISDLQKGLCDVVAKTGDVPSPNLIKFYRGHNFYLPLASPAYLEKYGLPKNPQDLTRHTVYFYSGPVRAETEFLTKGDLIERIPCRNSVHLPSIQAVRNAVLSGLGVAVDLTLNKCLEDVLEGRLVPILPGWFRTPLPVYTVISRSAWMLRRVRVFAKWFNDETWRRTEENTEKMRAFLASRHHIRLPEVSAPAQTALPEFDPA